MPPSISTAEAAESLRQIESSKLAFRSAIRDALGYQHLWLWGLVWAAQCVIFALRGVEAVWWVNAAAAVGLVGSTVIGISQGRNVRTRVDRRYLAALATVIVFGVAIWPIMLAGHGRLPATALYAYSALVAMQAYIITGIWFDNHLLWVGIVVSLFILIGYEFVQPWFWWWMAVFGGGTLFASGFYVRSAWK